MSEVSAGMSEEIVQSSEHKDPKFLRYQEQALNFFQTNNYFAIEDGQILFDIAKFKSKAPHESLRAAIGPLATRPEYGGGQWPLTLLHVFKDVKGYSSEDFDRIKRGERLEAKSLFYVPIDKDAALSPDAIKENNFYMGLWEAGPNGNLPQEYPTLKDGNRSGLSTREAITACHIFSPQIGDGGRGEDGKLYVRFNESDGEEKKPISAAFFRGWGYAGSPRDPHAANTRDGSLLADSPVDFFQRYCPNLVGHGIIRPHEDFSIMHTKNTLGEQVRKIRENGLALVQGKQYSLGRELGDGNHIVMQLSDTMAGIVRNDADGNMRLVRIFVLNTDPVTEIEGERKISSRSVVKKGEIEFIDPLQAEELGGENGALISRFDEFLQFSQQVGKEAGFNVLDLTIREKALATSLYQEHGDNSRLWSFIQKYGMNGLRSMLAVQEAQAHAESIWEIGEKMDATKLFGDVSVIVKMVSTYQDSIRGQLGDGDVERADKIAHIVMSATSDRLLALVPVIHQDPHLQGVIDVGDVISSLRTFKNRVASMYSSDYGLQLRTDSYQKLLDAYKSGSPDADGIVRELLAEKWGTQARFVEEDAISQVREQNDNFYQNNEELFASASETTGDTQKELDHFNTYLIKRELAGIPVQGVVLDMGCGDGERITRPMAQALKDKALVVGIDRMLAAKNPEENLQFIQGDFTKIPLADESVDLVTAHWSVINDLASRKLQLESFEELARVMKEDGEFYFDVPDLEGGEGSWKYAADEFHEVNPNEPYGMIHATFPNGRNKEFYIYPGKELEALLEQAGFSINSKESWKTESGKPRKTIVARLEHKITPARLAA